MIDLDQIESAKLLIGAILIWRSDKQQRLGDTYAKTVVVKA